MAKKHQVAFVGFRHAHIFVLLERLQKDKNIEITGLCEENPQESLLSTMPEIKLTHTNFKKMLSEVKCDIIAIGDYYGKRGSLEIEALKAGKHVISDKPLCTSLTELSKIEALSKKTGKKVGCMFDLHGVPQIETARELIQAGIIGKVVQVQYFAQHPLNLGVRPDWYFQKGCHGGTINDIACHATEAIRWMTGDANDKLVAARNWRALSQVPGPYFKDAAQFMYTLKSGCGVIGDVSYHGLKQQGFSLPTYWRFNIWGEKGMLQFNLADQTITLFDAGCKVASQIAIPVKHWNNYWDNFLADIEGRKSEMTTAQVISESRFTLQLQALADK